MIPNRLLKYVSIKGGSIEKINPNFSTTGKSRSGPLEVRSGPLKGYTHNNGVPLIGSEEVALRLKLAMLGIRDYTITDHFTDKPNHLESSHVVVHAVTQGPVQAQRHVIVNMASLRGKTVKARKFADVFRRLRGRGKVVFVSIPMDQRDISLLKQIRPVFTGQGGSQY